MGASANLRGNRMGKFFTVTPKYQADKAVADALDNLANSHEFVAECERLWRNYILYGTTHPESIHPLPPEPKSEDEHTVPF